MLEIHPLRALDDDLLRSLIVGYTSGARYEVEKVETPEHTRIELRLVHLPQLFVKRYPDLDTQTAAHYKRLVEQGNSFGAFEGERCVGLALAEPRTWNRSFLLHELHVSEDFQRQGIGRRLIEALAAHGRTLGLRCIVCETQTTNVPAIQFYRAMGFTLEGIDLSLYTNHDRERGEVALFMKKPLDE